MLVRALGETRCRACTFVKQATSKARGADSTLADDVAAALKRRFES
jgi:hypothetical protein